MHRGPVFIGGVSGSGKAHLRLILSSHPRIAITRRTYMWTRFYDRYGDIRQPRNFERCLAAMLSHKHTSVLRPDPDRIREDFWQGEPTYARLFALFHAHFAEQVGKPRWGDQLGFVEQYADAIFSAYEGAQIIHLIRNPYERYQAAIVRLRHRTGKVGQAMAAWLHSVGLAKRNERLYPDQYKVVRYEALCTDVERTVRDICSFLGEDFVPEMLARKDAPRLAADDDEVEEESNLNTPVSAPGANARTTISKREIAFVQTCAGKAMADCGYELHSPQLALYERLLFYTIDLPINLARMFTWRLRRSGRIAH